MKKALLFFIVFSGLLITGCKKDAQPPINVTAMVWTSVPIKTVIKVSWRGNTLTDTLFYHWNNGRTDCTLFLNQQGLLDGEGQYALDSVSNPEVFSVTAFTVDNSRNWSKSYSISNSSASCFSIGLN